MLLFTLKIKRLLISHLKFIIFIFIWYSWGVEIIEELPFDMDTELE